MMGRIGMSVLTDHLGWRTALATLSAVDLLVAIGFVLLLPPSRNFVRKTGVRLGYHVQAWAGICATAICRGCSRSRSC